MSCFSFLRKRGQRKARGESASHQPASRFRDQSVHTGLTNAKNALLSLPDELVLEVLPCLVNADLLCLRRVSSRLRRLMYAPSPKELHWPPDFQFWRLIYIPGDKDPGLPTNGDGEHLANRLRRDRYPQLVHYEKRYSNLLRKDVDLRCCSACFTTHPRDHFSPSELRKGPAERQCLPATALLRVCPHKTYTHAQLHRGLDLLPATAHPPHYVRYPPPDQGLIFQCHELCPDGKPCGTRVNLRFHDVEIKTTRDLGRYRHDATAMRLPDIGRMLAALIANGSIYICPGPVTAFQDFLESASDYHAVWHHECAVYRCRDKDGSRDCSSITVFSRSRDMQTGEWTYEVETGRYLPVRGRGTLLPKCGEKEWVMDCEMPAGAQGSDGEARAWKDYVQSVAARGLRKW